MSSPENSPYIGRTKTIYFDPQPELPKYSDPIEDTVRVNGFDITRRIDQFGKIILIARKQIPVSAFNDNKANVEIRVESAERKSLPIKAVNDERGRRAPWEEPKFIEVPDGENKMSSSLPKDKFVERHYRDSSILTPGEYFDTLIQFNEIMAKIQQDKVSK